MTYIRLSSGCRIDDPQAVAAAMLAEEWRYYDGVPQEDPDRVQPMDVLVTVAVNSFLTSAARIRSVHRGLAAACDHLLATIPSDADLRATDLVVLEDLLYEACQVPWVLVPVATKVLHRKRPRLLPMLDNVLLGYYFAASGRPELAGWSQDKARSASAAKVALDAFREDLVDAWHEITGIASGLGERGFPVSEVRLLELLLWSALEPQGYYRRSAS